MYRINNKAQLSVLFSLIITIWLITTPLATSAEWNDTFTDDKLSDWELSSHGEGIGLDEYNWEVEEGALVSGGIYGGVDNQRKFNTACRSNDVDTGHWYFDIFTSYSGIWGISLGQIFDPNADWQWDGVGWADRSLSLIRYPTYLQFAYFNGVVNNEVSAITIGAEEVANFDIMNDWHTFILTRHNSTFYGVQLDGEIIYSYNLPETMAPSTQKVCIFSLMGDGNRFDNLYGLNYGNTPPSSDPISRSLLITGTVLFVAVGIIAGIGIRNKLHKKKRDVIYNKSPNHLLVEISQQFNVTETSIGYLLFNQSQIDEKSEKEIRQAIPQEIINYRYLLHPIRLTIMKLLYNEYQIPSTDIKKALGISWGDFANHSKSLREKGYIEVKDVFNESGIKFQMVYLHEHGREEFEILLGLLQQFLEKGSPFDRLLSEDEPFSSDNLYPQS